MQSCCICNWINWYLWQFNQSSCWFYSSFIQCHFTSRDTHISECNLKMFWPSRGWIYETGKIKDIWGKGVCSFNSYFIGKFTLLRSCSLFKKCKKMQIFWATCRCDDHFHLSCGIPNNVFVVLAVSAAPPLIAVSPAVLNVIEDQQLTLPCVLLAGNPLPERQWLHNYGLVSKIHLALPVQFNETGLPMNSVFASYDFPLLQVTSDQYVTVRRDGSLHIDRVQLSDAGDYSCLAENAIGATNHTTTVNVHGRVQNHVLHTIECQDFVRQSCILQKRRERFRLLYMMIKRSKVASVVHLPLISLQTHMHHAWFRSIKHVRNVIKICHKACCWYINKCASNPVVRCPSITLTHTLPLKQHN